MNIFDSVPVDEIDASVASETGRRLSALLDERPAIKMQIVAQELQEEALVLPPQAARLLAQILTAMAEGDRIAVTPIQRELTTQQAADLLNVSRPFLVQLLEAGEIPFHKVGTHRRVAYEDVVNYRDEIKTRRRETLQELTAQAQELDMGYCSNPFLSQ